MSVNWILLFEAYRYTTVAMATLSYYFAPVIITVSSTLLFRERLTSRQVFCFVMSTFGLVLVIGVSSGGGSNDLLGILLGLGAALFYAAVVLLIGVNRLNWQSYFMYQIAITVFSFIPLILWAAGLVTHPAMAIITVILTVGILALTIFLGDRRFKNELIRRFHL